MKFHRILSIFFLLLLTFSLLAAPANAIEEMEVAAKAALLADPTTGEVLYAKNIHERLYPASLTKIMTALLVLEEIDAGRLSMDTEITASETAINAVPSDGSTANIKAGDTHTLETLLYCILVVSANEACNILAETISGSMEAFVDKMNAKAEELGCTNTHFVTTNGLHDDNHYTSAWDLYLIIQEARTHEAFMKFCDTRYFTKPATDQSPAQTLYTTNLLLSPYRSAGYVYQYAHGIKTGQTSAAGYCLASSGEKNGRALIGVILGAERVTLEDGTAQTQSFSEMARLFEWGFNNFSRQTLLTGKELLQEVAVELSEVTQVAVHPAQSIERLLPADLAPEDLEQEITIYQEPVDAPITEGTVLGEITLSYGDTVYATVKLLANSDVDASRLLVFRRNALEFLSQKKVWYIAGGALLAIAVLCLLVFLFRRRGGRRRYGRPVYHGRANNYRGRRRRC